MPIVVNINSGTDFEPVSEGVHSVTLADIEDLGVVESNYGPKHKVRFTWLTDEADEKTGKTKYLFKRYTMSLHEKATLRKDVEKILGRPLGNVQSFDIETLIGSANTVVVEHSENQGKVYANVASIMKPKGQKVAIPTDFQRKSGKAAAAAVLSPARQAVKANTQPISDEDIPF